MAEWHEDDALWIELAPVIFNEERLRQAPTDVVQALALLQLPAGATVCDLGCGIGRHSVEFAARGHLVTGVDRTASYLERARAAGTEKDVAVEWVHADMRRFRRDAGFDAVVSLLTSFGYFADPADDRRVIDNVFASLRPGGAFLLDIMSREVLARIFRERDWHEEPGGTILLEERRVVDDWSSLDVRWIVLRGTTRHEHRFTLRQYTADDLKGLLSGVGFSGVKAYGSLAGTPYDHAAQRLVLVARKPADYGARLLTEGFSAEP